MLKKNRIRDKLRELQEYYEELSELKEEDFSNLKTRRACEKSFELCAETIIDICNLFISGLNFGMPEDNRDSIRKLIERKIIPKQLGENLMLLVGFRNLLVHRYGEIDSDKELTFFTEDIDDILNFISSIEDYLER